MHRVIEQYFIDNNYEIVNFEEFADVYRGIESILSC